MIWSGAQPLGKERQMAWAWRVGEGLGDGGDFMSHFLSFMWSSLHRKVSVLIVAMETVIGFPGEPPG